LISLLVSNSKKKEKDERREKGGRRRKRGRGRGTTFSRNLYASPAACEGGKRKEVAETVSKRKGGKRKKERKTETKERRICVSGRKKERCTSRTFSDYSHSKFIYIVLLLVRLAVR